VQERKYDKRSCLILHNILKSISKTDNTKYVQHFSSFFFTEGIPFCSKYTKK